MLWLLFAEQQQQQQELMRKEIQRARREFGEIEFFLSICFVAFFQAQQQGALKSTAHGAVCRHTHRAHKQRVVAHSSVKLKLLLSLAAAAALNSGR